jgi:hypothetical protein
MAGIVKVTGLKFIEFSNAASILPPYGSLLGNSRVGSKRADHASREIGQIIDVFLSNRGMGKDLLFLNRVNHNISKWEEI